MKKRFFSLLCVFFMAVCLVAGASAKEAKNDGDTVTRIAWIHELAVRFNPNSEDCNNTEVTFSDYSQSEDFYLDALWAWSMGLFDQNEDMSIDPYGIATREFAAYTLTSCLDLGLNASGSFASSNGNEITVSEEKQIALNRNWFGDESTSFDTAVSFDEVAVMLSDAEDIVAFEEVREDYVSTYKFADGVIEIPADVDFSISPDETTVTIYRDNLSLAAGDNFLVYLDSLPIAYTALVVTEDAGNTLISVKKADASVFEYVDAQGVIPLTAENSEFIVILLDSVIQVI